MSHNQSPGPSAHPNSQMFVQPASSTPSTRQKNKAYATGIAAGVEDEKYQAKYKELKRKVKEIEMDNDKLQFKVLTAKKSIQRMKLERAVLYERLSAVPPSPDIHSHHALPPMHAGPGVPPQHPQQMPPSTHHRDHSRGMDISDHNAPEYLHGPGNVRVISGPDGRSVPVSDGPIGPGVPPSHAMSAIHMSRRGSASGHDSRQLPPLSQLTPVQHHEHPRGHAHSQAHSPHLHSHSNGSDSRSRPHSSSSRSRGHQLPTQGPPHGYHQGGIPHPQQYSPESIPHGHGAHSPPPGHERDRTRRHDTHDRSSHNSDPYPQGRQQISHASSPTSTRGSSTRVHNHQRVGPGTNINHPDFEHERDLERERNWSRQREHDYDREAAREYANSAAIRASPPPAHLRSRPEREYQDHAPSYRLREEHVYSREPVGPGMYGRSSRSDTPGSGSGSASGGAGEAHPRPDTHPHYYDRERARPYAPRSANQVQAPNEEIDFVHEDGRSYNRERDRIGGSYMPSEQHRPDLESSRKRSRNDMEVDGEDDVAASPAGDSSGGGREGSSRYVGGHRDDRGSKRLHQEGASASTQGYGGQDDPEEEHSDD
ncbi:hypothetical protein HYDPIDRAFT_23106 [Hydnomerulius pinastri MD-312]|nr:hypothetical protein HYDPIDRAFT_23106 [Hydnomerulius pinastri MD-312]